MRGGRHFLAAAVPAGATGTFQIWEGYFEALHAGGSVTIDDRDYVGGSLFARKTYTNSMSAADGSVSEQTTFDLRHTPE